MLTKSSDFSTRAAPLTQSGFAGGVPRPTRRDPSECAAPCNAMQAADRRRSAFTLLKPAVTYIGIGVLLLAGSGPLFADDFVPLFNGKNLDGWVNVNCAPKTFTVRDEMIVCTGIPTGLLRTTRQYENFELDLEWRHLHEGGNSGLYIWSDPLTARGQP